MTIRIKLLRKQKGWTLDFLAEKTGLTKSYISKVERGICIPSIAVALKLSQALDVDVARLFSDRQNPPLITITRATELGTSDNVKQVNCYESIASDVAPKKLLPFIVYPSRDFVTSAFKEHAGEEFLFVHKGRIEIEFPNQTVQLKTGDSIYFNALIPHRVRSIGNLPAKILLIVSSERGDNGS
jgi:transcriptional regulator with XRE-family HTH domain